MRAWRGGKAAFSVRWNADVGNCVMAEWFRLARLTLLRWRGQQQGVINRLAQTESRLNISTQVHHDGLLIHDAIRFCPSTVGRQRDVYGSVGGSDCWCIS